ncbi:MAG: PAS domain S-box protein [Desulfarculus sp.]|nr:PAS domain S-box protein [Desulfarculus sp.]
MTKHPWAKLNRRHWRVAAKSRPLPPPRTAAHVEPNLDYREVFEKLLHGDPLGRAVLGVIPDPVVVYDHQGAVVYFNPAFTKTFGWKLDELLGQRVPFVPEEEMGVSLAAIQHLFASGGSGVFNSRRLTKDGRLLDVRISATGIVDVQGEVVGMVVNLTDQTAIKNAERALGRQSAFFEQLFQASPDAILVVEGGGGIQRANQEFSRLFGYREEEVIGRNATELLAPGELRAEGLKVRDRIGRGESIRIETRRQTKDGRLVDVDLSATPIILDQHRLGDLVVYRDITAHKAAEAALTQSEELYRTLFESAGDAIFLIEGDVFVACNNQACDMLGAPREKIVGAHPWDFSPPEQAPGLSSRQYGHELMTAARRGDAQLFEWRHRRLDGVVFDAEVRMTRVAVAGKSLLMTLVRDVTQRRQAEAALKQSEDKFAKAFMASPTWVTIAAVDDGRFLDVNQAFLAGTGFSRPEVIGRSALDIKLWADPAQRERMVELLRRDGRIQGEQVTFRRRDGGLIHCELSVELIEVGARPCFLAVMIDVTERKRAEAELELIHFTLNHAPVAAYLISSDGSFAYVNQTACDRLGYTRQELLSMRVRDLDPVYTEENRQALWKKLRVKRHLRLESTHRAKSGEVFPVEVRVNHLEWAGEEYHCVFVSDITESRQAQRALAESEERFRVLSEESPLGVSLISADGKTYEYVNPAFTAIFGYTLEEVRQSGRWARLVFPDPALRRQVLADWAQDKAGIRAGQSRVRTYEVVCKDGSRKTILFRPVLTSSGRDFVLYEDITQQVGYEKALRESERRYRELVDNISDFIYTHDLEGRFLTVNRMAAASLGYAPDDLIGRRISDLMLPEHRRDFYQQYLVKLREHGEDHGMSIYLGRDGAHHYLEYKSFLVTDPEAPPYVRGSAREVTERVLAERERKRLEEQLVQSQKLEALGTLTGGVAHDFNNLLTGIQGNLNLALATLGSGHPASRFLANASLAAERAARVTQQLLTLGRRAERHVVPLCLADPVQDTLRLLSETIDRRIEISTDIAPDLWLVEADEAQMSQVVMNLCVNARDAILHAIAVSDANPPPAAPTAWRITLKLRNLELNPEQAKANAQAYPGRFVVLSVSDNGCGIDGDTFERIFEPFFTTKPLGEGTGLGLATVYAIVRQHRGWIEVASQAGLGASFSIYLPARTGPAALQPQPPASPHPRGGSETILVVDDEPMILELAKEALSSLGYRVITAGDGRQALATFASLNHELDLVILDLTMPGISGHEVMESMLKLRPQTRIIISSGHTASGPPAHPAAAYLDKPYRIEQLAAVVREVLDAAQNSRLDQIC